MFPVTPLRFRYNRTELYHLSNASGLRSSPTPVNFVGAGGVKFICAVMVGGFAGGGCASSDILSSLSLLLLELLSSGSLLAASAFCFAGVFGKVPGVLVAAFSASLADSLRTFRASSLSSCLAASSISNCLVARVVSCSASYLAFASRYAFVGLDSSSRETSLPPLVRRGSMLPFSLTCRS